MIYKAADILKECEEKKSSIGQLTREDEASSGALTAQQLDANMKEVLAIMADSSSLGLKKEVFSLSGMTGGSAKKLWNHRKEASLSGEFILSAMARALSTSEVNASMGRIVAAPTAGASGILPAALMSAKEKLSLNEDDLVLGLYTAGAVGKIVAISATISGADGGCQAECGTAAAMAAAALVELMGGSPQAAFHAASFALIHIMGLVCDPIAGFVEFPCSLRNASGIVNAFISADLAMAGLTSPIPFDEVVEAMYQVGRMLPEALRETALGGIAATPSARALEEKYLTKNK
ncbi:MAG: L-serine ammonia-lyase, iron-sulfur-dependent, subunit alpha [Tissierellia bacterium]|nr:L-serine ammonia-lyase, iron-sulfur-dependent, subunit alpha [Tissierellia bacterium]